MPQKNFRAAKFEKETKRAILATESPTPMYRGKNGKLIPEILMMDGMRMPDGNELTLLDTHDDSSVRNILGSYRNL